MFRRLLESLRFFEPKARPEAIDGTIERLGFDHHRPHSGPEWLVTFEGVERALRLLDAVELPAWEHEALTLTRPGDRVALSFLPTPSLEGAPRHGPEPASLLGFRNLDLEAKHPRLRPPAASP